MLIRILVFLTGEFIVMDEDMELLTRADGLVVSSLNVPWRELRRCLSFEYLSESMARAVMACGFNNHLIRGVSFEDVCETSPRLAVCGLNNQVIRGVSCEEICEVVIGMKSTCTLVFASQSSYVLSRQVCFLRKPLKNQ